MCDVAQNLCEMGLWATVAAQQPGELLKSKSTNLGIRPPESPCMCGGRWGFPLSFHRLWGKHGCREKIPQFALHKGLTHVQSYPVSLVLGCENNPRIVASLSERQCMGWQICNETGNCICLHVHYRNPGQALLDSSVLQGRPSACYGARNVGLTRSRCHHYEQ